MKMKFALAGAFAGAIIATGAVADYPERNIQVVFPWGTGGAAYAVDQIVADKMGEKLGVKLPVVSKPGGAGVRALTEGLAADADGYTVLSTFVANLVVAPIRGNADWNYKDFIPLYPVRSSVLCIGSRADETRWSDFPSFIKYLQDNPAKTTYTTGAIDNLPHLVISKILQSQNAVSRPVPYQDMNEGVKEVNNKLLDWMGCNANIAKNNPDTFKVLAVLSDNPAASDLYGGAPLVTSFGLDIGLTGLSPTGWNWWTVEAGTPPEIVDKLREAMKYAIESDEYKEAMARTGSVIPPYNWDEYEAIVGAVDSQLAAAAAAQEWEAEAVKAASQ